MPVTWVGVVRAELHPLLPPVRPAKPKGVQRDTGGYAVALTASMKHIFTGEAGETMFSTSDIGWVVGHSYIIYGPLLAGMATIMYEGTPLRPDAGHLVADRREVQGHGDVLGADGRARTQEAGSGLPQEVRSVVAEAPVPGRRAARRDLARVDHGANSAFRSSTTTGRPRPAGRCWRSAAASRTARSSSARPPSRCSATTCACSARTARKPAPTKGIVGIVPPLPPGCLSTVWGQDDRFVSTYFSTFSDPGDLLVFRLGYHDENGYYTILGRMDDVINVAGHRLGTREIEEAVQAHPAIAEVAVVGVADQLKGQMPMAFAVVKDASVVDTAEKRAALEKEVMKKVDSLLAQSPGRAVHFIGGLPKTRSGKMLRRSIQALAEGRDAGDLTTIDDPSTLEQIKEALAK